MALTAGGGRGQTWVGWLFGLVTNAGRGENQRLWDISRGGGHGATEDVVWRWTMEEE